MGGYGPRAQVQSSVQMRTESDEIMGTWWAFLPLIAAALQIVGVAVSFVNAAAGIIVMVLMAIISAILELFLFYKLLSRQNNHFRRESAERTAIVAWFKEKAQEMGRIQFIGPQLGAMESINQEAQFKEKEQSIILIILLIIPVVNFIIMLYLLYIFTKYPYEHDQRWHHFTQNAQMAGQQMGLNIMMPSWKTQPERSFVIFLVLTIVTFGLFMFYWIYCIIKDMNEHMKNQWAFEDQLLREMSR
jgi:flagellar basal body-associated protein FliL